MASEEMAKVKTSATLPQFIISSKAAKFKRTKDSLFIEFEIWLPMQDAKYSNDDMTWDSTVDILSIVYIFTIAHKIEKN